MITLDQEAVLADVLDMVELVDTAEDLVDLVGDLEVSAVDLAGLVVVDLVDLVVVDPEAVDQVAVDVNQIFEFNK